MLIIEDLWKEMKKGISSYFIENSNNKYGQEIGELKQEIQEAHQQWQKARKYFENVSEPELIDHASYKIEAARTKYMYLLKKAKNYEEDKGGK